MKEGQQQVKRIESVVTALQRLFIEGSSNDEGSESRFGQKKRAEKRADLQRISEASWVMFNIEQ